ncbi:Luciferase-like monooxygenase [Beutenbergia cavernae DSM 12333]|uniref:Luciferase-like monooxygenase n=1 Tax=Beutenbergia cavernae (strain ATCC BAA-8 / DSM 12333 / CCUG 43141 / JCM 11478 / NBRC 16432 / NCIMB 13614 / HKI 0122) TaxID=471853 RepID=C5BYA7_BEUC1|nr:LLM class flavin-dependent oxidoreductase [Beutenbergia cavernae]ACQ81007.1 Luciferase-like monooxygenase [Beutenbergia cavernae DSM 12333]
MHMELGVYTFGDVHPDPVTGEQTDPGQRIRDILERVELAEQVGLDYVGVGEHHRPDYAISSPSTVIAAALARTERIHVGSAVTVLSTEDPVRVYQQFATMDAFSGGRVELLAGRGSFIESYPLFGARLDDYDALYDEKIQLLLALDDAGARDGTVSWSGRFRPTLDDALVLPRPADLPGRGRRLNLAVATGGTPESSVRAGVLGLGVNYAIIGGRPAQFAPLAELYRSEFRPRGLGEGVDTGPSVAVSGMGFVADDPKAARDYFYPYWHASMDRIARERGFPLPNRITYDATTTPDGAYAVGSPEEVAEKIVRLAAVLGHDRQILQMDLSGVPQRESLRAIELLGTAVKPLVDAELPRATAEAE